MGAVGVSPSALPLRAVERMGAVCVLPSVPSPHVVVRVKFPILPRASAATATHAVVYTYGTSNVSFPSSRVGASFFGSTTPLLQAGFDVSGVGLCCEQGQGKEITENLVNAYRRVLIVLEVYGIVSYHAYHCTDLPYLGQSWHSTTATAHVRWMCEYVDDVV